MDSPLRLNLQPLPNGHLGPDASLAPERENVTAPPRFGTQAQANNSYDKVRTEPRTRDWLSLLVNFEIEEYARTMAA